MLSLRLRLSGGDGRRDLSPSKDGKLAHMKNYIALTVPNLDALAICPELPATSFADRLLTVQTAVNRTYIDSILDQIPPLSLARGVQ